MPYSYPADPSSSTSSASSAASSSSSTVAQSPPHPGFEHGIKVVVVDDDPLTRKLTSRVLTRIGCKVSTLDGREQ